MLTSYATFRPYAAPAFHTDSTPALWRRLAPAELQDWPRSLGTIRLFTQDQEVYCERDEAQSFFKVVSGVVRTYKVFYDGRRYIDGFLVAGDIFGIEFSGERSLSAEAVCDCTVISYCRQQLDISAREDVGVTRQLFTHAMRGLARAQEHALLLGRKSALEKVVAFLLEWAEHSTNKDVIVLAMPRQDIADYLGFTIETVSRILSSLDRDSIIGLLSARQIRVMRPEILRAIGTGCVTD